jgi:hypothetical protein
LDSTEVDGSKKKKCRNIHGYNMLTQRDGRAG